MSLRRAAPVLLCVIGACTLGDLYDVKEVKVRIFDNLGDRRTHEFDLTHSIIHEMSARGIRVNTKDAPYTLEGRIVDMTNASVVEGKTDTVVVGSLRMRVEIRLLNAEGVERWKDVRTEGASITASRGETLESARQEVFDRLARWVVTHFEKEW